MSELAELPNQEVTVLNTLQTALDKGVDADSLGKLLDMQERVLDRQAEQSYTQSMVAVQSEMEPIKPNKENTHTQSKYADMTAIIQQITPIYTKHGFALSFGNDNSPEPGHVRVTCDVMHSQGHSKPYFTDIPLDTDGISGKTNKTAVHGTGSAITYGQRYLTKLIFNLSTGDDDDGNSAGGDTRSAIEVENFWVNQMAELRKVIPSIHMLKDYIGMNELKPAVEVWQELTDDEKSIIWNPAPTKGGILTTKEREVMKSDTWAEARDSLG